MTSKPVKKENEILVSFDASEANRQIEEVLASAKLLNDFAVLVRRKLMGALSPDAEQFIVPDGMPALVAGKHIFRMKIESRTFELVRSALGALNLGRAHAILNGAGKPKRATKKRAAK